MTEHSLVLKKILQVRYRIFDMKIEEEVLNANSTVFPNATNCEIFSAIQSNRHGGLQHTCIFFAIATSEDLLKTLGAGY